MRFSVVIPVYQEEAMVSRAVEDLVDRLREFEEGTWELVLVQNGSTDATPRLVDELAATHPEVRAVHLPRPDYGAALRTGIFQARGDFVIGDEIDLGDLDFYRRALEILESGEADLVIGSKALPGSEDRRPLVRKFATRSINLLLRWVLGFEGSDTHGLKAFRRATLLPVATICQVTGDLFASEMVIRAQRGQVVIREIPIQLHEKRPPAINLLRRIPKVVRSLWTLRRVLGPVPRR